MTTAPHLSLYKINAQLLDLMQLRDVVLSDPDLLPDDQRAAVETIDKQLIEFVQREVQKADGIAAYLRECEARAGVLRAEAKRLNERAAAEELRAERLERITISVMQAFGKTEVVGQDSTLRLRKNPPSADVRQPELLPAVYQAITIKLSRDLWNRIGGALMSNKANDALCIEMMGVDRQAGASKPEPMLSKIKEELKRSDPCKVCDGKGERAYTTGSTEHAVKPCEACKGTGKVARGVPGAVLVTDSMRLEVK